MRKEFLPWSWFGNQRLRTAIASALVTTSASLTAIAQEAAPVVHSVGTRVLETIADDGPILRTATALRPHRIVAQAPSYTNAIAETTLGVQAVPVVQSAVGYHEQANEATAVMSQTIAPPSTSNAAPAAEAPITHQQPAYSQPDSALPPMRTHESPVTQTRPVAQETPAVAIQEAASVEVPHHGPWWEQEVGQPKRSAQAVSVGVNTLLMSALRNSAQIRVFSDLPLIRETAITEADAAFDWMGFIETRWDDTNEPVGSTLTTGGPPRFENQNFNYSFGSRRRNTLGGQLEFSQRIGYQDNNSVFFLPNNQGTSRLTVSYTQPLMRGRGRAYNTSLTVLAQIDTKIARDEFSRQLQSHLLEVTRAYWSLYLERAGLLQRQRLLGRAEEILGDLERRQSLDTVNSQVVRARAAVESRRAEILRAEMAVRNAESRIRSLTNDPSWGSSDAVELLPVDMPFRGYTDVSMDTAMATAMQSRPEIGQAIKQVKAACVRMNMAKNEILPMLNLVLESYLAGLRGDTDIGGAWADQFTEGEPSYSIGLQYEYPIWNRAAKARLQRRRLEVRQLQNQFRTTTETLKLEVAVAVRELATSFKEMEAKHRAMTAATAEVEYISERWRALGAEDRSASLMLEDLLNAQSRLADAEYGFLNAGLTYNLAQMNYKKAVGTLLQDEQVVLSRNCTCNLPGQTADKAGGCQACNAGAVLGSGYGVAQPVSPQAMVEQQPPFATPVSGVAAPRVTPADVATEPYRVESMVDVSVQHQESPSDAVTQRGTFFVPPAPSPTDY